MSPRMVSSVLPLSRMVSASSRCSGVSPLDSSSYMAGDGRAGWEEACWTFVQGREGSSGDAAASARPRGLSHAHAPPLSHGHVRCCTRRTPPWPCAHLSNGNHPVQRGANLVAHVCKEHGLGLCSSFGSNLCLLQQRRGGRRGGGWGLCGGAESAASRGRQAQADPPSSSGAPPLCASPPPFSAQLCAVAANMPPSRPAALHPCLQLLLSGAAPHQLSNVRLQGDNGREQGRADVRGGRGAAAQRAQPQPKPPPVILSSRFHPPNCPPTRPPTQPPTQAVPARR